MLHGGLPKGLKNILKPKIILFLHISIPVKAMYSTAPRQLNGKGLPMPIFLGLRICWGSNSSLSLFIER